MSETSKQPNYFEFYNLPVQFTPDLNAVKSKFYELSKKYHPDFYANEGEEKQEEVLNLSTLNNKAYQVLTNPNKRLQYILTLTDTIKEGENYQLPQSFLMEMMEVNESLMDMEFEADATKLLALNEEIDAIEQQVFNELKQLTDWYDVHEQEQKTLLAIKDLYYRQKYISRIRERLLKM